MKFACRKSRDAATKVFAYIPHWVQDEDCFVWWEYVYRSYSCGYDGCEPYYSASWLPGWGLEPGKGFGVDNPAGPE